MRGNAENIFKFHGVFKKRKIIFFMSQAIFNRNLIEKKNKIRAQNDIFDFALG